MSPVNIRDTHESPPSYVKPEQRFNQKADRPCPVCGGGQDDERGQGVRCYGYTSDDGKSVLCTREDAAGDLPFNDKADGYWHYIAGPCGCGKWHGGHEVEAEYEYRGVDGSLLYEVIRFHPKDFRPRRHSEHGYIWNLDGVGRALYRLPELLGASAGEIVFIVEGEKDTDNLRSLKLVATCSPFGAGKWRPEYSEHLCGRRVVILPDNDKDGRQHAEQVARSLGGIAASVKIVPLPGVGDKGDISDWLGAGGTKDDLLRLVDETPEHVPSEPDPAEQPPGRLQFRTAREILSGENPGKVEWIAKPLTARGTITELSGKVKLAGKTTLALYMVRAVVDGTSFMGEDTTKSPVVYLTEQPRHSFRLTLWQMGLERDDLHILFWSDTMGASWEEIVRAAAERCQTVGAVLLVVDTLPQFAGIAGDAENDAGAALKAMRPLQQAAGDGLGILVVRHDRKSGGEVGDSARGSSAFSGAADIIFSLRRPEGNTRSTLREVHGIGRPGYDVPERLVIELAGDEYRLLGDMAAVVRQEAEAAILRVVEKSEHALTLDEVVTGAGVKRTMAQEVLRTLVDAKRVKPSGGGKKNDPLRYWRPDLPPPDPDPAGERPAGKRPDNDSAGTTRPREEVPAESDIAPADRGGTPPLVEEDTSRQNAAGTTRVGVRVPAESSLDGEADSAGDAAGFRQGLINKGGRKRQNDEKVALKSDSASKQEEIPPQRSAAESSTEAPTPDKPPTGAASDITTKATEAPPPRERDQSNDLCKCGMPKFHLADNVCDGGVDEEMFDAVCSECGAKTHVPFRPREGRPVYCLSCFRRVRDRETVKKVE